MKQSYVLSIESMDLEGRGIAKLEGKVMFVEGALPGETVEAEILKARTSYGFMRTKRILQASNQRVTPLCKHFEICGGCALQHVEPRAQVMFKQRALEDMLWHIGKLKPEIILPAIEGQAWNYRHRARLGIQYFASKKQVLIGFRERHSNRIANLNNCHILPARVSALFEPLRTLITSLSIPEHLPQLEVAVSEDQQINFALRHLMPLQQEDIAKLREFAALHQVSWWLQPHDSASLHLLNPREPSRLHYSLPDFQVSFNYRPGDFTQVNPDTNQLLVSTALRLLALRQTDHVIDLFCGLGNFTLPLGRKAGRVLGIEGSADLIQRAQTAATNAAMSDRVEFKIKNLFATEPADWKNWHRALGKIDKALIDPPREGALALVQALADPANKSYRPQRIVYVSCHPASLARDSNVLVHQAGYLLKAAGVVNMFAQTAHIESVAVFERAV